jgi:DNA mismatch endonuclease (patch repair protein)
MMPKFRAVVFVHGCFWHRHENCRYATIPSTRPEFWTAKLDRNVARDSEVRSALLKSGWRVATVCACSTRWRASIPRDRGQPFHAKVGSRSTG